MELSQLHRQHRKSIQEVARDILIRSEYNRDYVFQFREPFYEAVLNAIEHGTDFCERGNVDIKINSGENGILATVSQPTQGLSLEQVEKALSVTDPSNLHYERQSGEIRGMGLACYSVQENARVWFEFYSKLSPEFKLILLETRERIEKLSL